MKPAYKSFAIAAALAAFATAPALAQAPAATDPDPAPGAPGPYAGADKASFYNVEARLAAVEARIRTMSPRQARPARAQLVSLKAFLAQQQARHGEVRDFDREAVSARLSRLESLVGVG